MITVQVTEIYSAGKGASHITPKTIRYVPTHALLNLEVISVTLTPIPLRIAALVRERNSLSEYPVERLAGVIREIGFRCISCARCCTRGFNGHVFLLDRDVTSVRTFDPAALEPARDLNSATSTGYSMSPGMQ